MQIVIDVPQHLVYQGFERPFTEEEKNALIRAIGNGTPLNKIKTEIKGMTPTYHNLNWSITDLVPISEVLKLIDKYKTESEEA